MTIEINTSFTVQTGETYRSTNWAAFYLDQHIGRIQFQNLGLIEATGQDATGIHSWTSFGTILNAGVIRAVGGPMESGNLIARGIYGESWCADIINTGRIEVSGHFAAGIVSFSVDQRVDNQGVISVHGTGDNIGIRLLNGGTFTNSGRLEVFGPNATGVEIAHFEGALFENRGEIVVDDAGNPWESYGVRLHGDDPYGGGITTAVNYGLIQADIAVSISVSSSFDRPEPRHHVINHGVIRGEVQTGDGDDLFVNTGQFEGRLAMGNGDDRADLSDGSNSGLIDMGAGSDVVIGSRFADHIDGSGGDDFIDGGGGADLLDGGFGDDDVSGGAGDDVLFGNFGGDRVLGGDGDDWINGDWEYAIEGLIGADALFGEAGNDVIFGGEGDDLLDGGDGDDILDGGAGDDRVYGGTGHDIFTVSGTSDSYTLLRDGDGFILKGADGTDRLTDVEIIQFSDGKMWDIARQYWESGGPLFLPVANTGGMVDDIQPGAVSGGDFGPLPPLFRSAAAHHGLAAVSPADHLVHEPLFGCDRVGGGWDCDGFLF